MDCNSYSYAPSMLDGPDDRIDSFENDDMQTEIYPWGNAFAVYAGSYDGSMDIYETFRDLDRARELYAYIVEHYHDTPPGPELDGYIRQLKREEARQHMTTSGRAYARQDAVNRASMRAWYEARHAENLAADPPRPDLVIFTEHILSDFDEIDADDAQQDGRRTA